MMRGALVLLALIAATESPAAQSFEREIEISAERIVTWRGVTPGTAVDGVIWRGGLVLGADNEAFGGISGATFVDDDDLVMVTDQGHFVSARLVRDDDGTPGRLDRGHISAIRNSAGDDLPHNYSRDAEAVDAIVRDGEIAAIRVGFENLTRVADFELDGRRPMGPAKPVQIPARLSLERSNESLESVYIAPDASPVAGSTLLIAEHLPTDDGDHSAWLLGVRDRGPLSMTAAPGFNPTDCAFLPDGDLLVLERGTSFLSFTMQVRRIGAADVRPGARLAGEVILSASGGDIDNMEALAVRPGDDDAPHRIVIMSDDNFNDWERTLLLEFDLPR